MRVAIGSDIHGSSEAFHALVMQAQAHGAECLWLAGDLGIEELDPADLSALPLTLVRGNCDSSWDFSEAGRPLPPLFQRFSHEGHTVLMTHGDRWPSPYGFSLQSGDLFIFGHIHAPRLYRDKEGIYILNPGSTTYPRHGSDPSWALLDGKTIEIRFLYRDRVETSISLAWS